MADKNLQTIFEAFVKADGSKDDKLSVDVAKKWFKDSGVLGKDTGITEADVDTAFSKCSKDKQSLEFSELKEFVTALAKEKKVEPKELMGKLASVGQAKAVAPGVADVGAKTPKM